MGEKVQGITMGEKDMGAWGRPFGIRDKVGYMFGDFGNDFSFIFASSYLMVFYTKVLGLSGYTVGLLFLEIGRASCRERV